MTDTEEAVTSPLTDEQARRTEALWQAHGLLPKRQHSTGDLIILAEFILSGTLEGELEEVRFEPGAITVAVEPGSRCACKIAAEFTGGEQDVPHKKGNPDLIENESRNEFNADATPATGPVLVARQRYAEFPEER